MTPRRDAAGWTGTEYAIRNVLLFLHASSSRELSYDDIAAGARVTVKYRLRRAVKVARAVAHARGDRLERFRRHSQRKVHVTRYITSGSGDELSGRDALAAGRVAMTALREAHRAADFVAGEEECVESDGFAVMAKAAAECLTTVAGILRLGPEVVRPENQGLSHRMVAELESQLGEDQAA